MYLRGDSVMLVGRIWVFLNENNLSRLSIDIYFDILLFLMY